MFRNLFGSAKVECNRRARSTQLYLFLSKRERLVTLHFPSFALFWGLLAPRSTYPPYLVRNGTNQRMEKVARTRQSWTSGIEPESGSRARAAIGAKGV